MKRICFLLCVTGLAAVLILPMVNADNRAVVIKDDGMCGVLDGNGYTVEATGDIQVMNHGGNTILVCKVKKVSNDTGQAVIWNYENTGLLCGTYAGPTDDWQNTVSASGNVTLVCKVHK